MSPHRPVHPEVAPSDSVEVVPSELAELVDALRALPEPHRLVIDPIIGRVIEGIKRRRQILTLVQDALSQLRLDMKYLIFDLEATRRERDEYRRKVEEL